MVIFNSYVSSPEGSFVSLLGDLPDLSSSDESFGVHPIQRQPQLVVLVLGFTDHSKNEDRICHKPTNLAGCCS